MKMYCDLPFTASAHATTLGPFASIVKLAASHISHSGEVQLAASEVHYDLILDAKTIASDEESDHRFAGFSPQCRQSELWKKYMKARAVFNQAVFRKLSELCAANGMMLLIVSFTQQLEGSTPVVDDTLMGDVNSEPSWAATPHTSGGQVNITHPSKKGAWKGDYPTRGKHLAGLVRDAAASLRSAKKKPAAKLG
tara:strand:- start:36 stop:620 length:585 start_codon:yes stop_codon:yes gene_type:complete